MIHMDIERLEALAIWKVGFCFVSLSCVLDSLYIYLFEAVCGAEESLSYCEFLAVPR